MIGQNIRKCQLNHQPALYLQSHSRTLALLAFYEHYFKNTLNNITALTLV